MAQVKDRGGGGEERKETSVSFLPPPLPPLSLFGSRFISRSVKTESPLPWYFFAPKPNGNACYTGYTQYYILISLFSFVCFVYSLLFGTNCYISVHTFSKITLYFVARLSSTTSIFLVVLCLQYVQHFHPGSLCNDKPFPRNLVNAKVMPLTFFYFFLLRKLKRTMDCNTFFNVSAPLSKYGFESTRRGGPHVYAMPEKNITPPVFWV